MDEVLGTHSPTNLVDMVSVHFTADLSAWRDPKVMISWFINPDLGGSVGTGFLYPIGPWDDSGHSREWNFVFAMGADDPQRLDEDAARDRVLRTLGIEGLPVTVHSVSHWSSSRWSPTPSGPAAASSPATPPIVSRRGERWA